jgi:hypothetical protein
MGVTRRTIRVEEIGRGGTRIGRIYADQREEDMNETNSQEKSDPRKSFKSAFIRVLFRFMSVKNRLQPQKNGRADFGK